VRLASVVGERVALLSGAALAAGEVPDGLDERVLLVAQGLDGHGSPHRSLPAGCRWRGSYWRGANKPLARRPAASGADNLGGC